MVDIVLCKDCRYEFNTRECMNALFINGVYLNQPDEHSIGGCSNGVKKSKRCMEKCLSCEQKIQECQSNREAFRNSVYDMNCYDKKGRILHEASCP